MGLGKGAGVGAGHIWWESGFNLVAASAAELSPNIGNCALNCFYPSSASQPRLPAHLQLAASSSDPPRPTKTHQDPPNPTKTQYRGEPTITCGCRFGFIMGLSKQTTLMVRFSVCLHALLARFNLKFGHFICKHSTESVSRVICTRTE